MAVRIKDWMIPYTWGTWIEITNNHVINVLLRAMNNLIHVNDERELYVDLQLDDWIEPDDDFPVGVTTGKVLEEDWWQSNGIILNWKTTSWDYVRLIYGTDWKLYYDPWTWEWIEIASGDTIEELEANINTKTFWLESTSDTTTAQSILDWYLDEKNPLIINWGNSFIMTYYSSSSIVFRSHLTIANTNSYHRVTAEQITITHAGGEVTNVNKATTELGKFLSTDSDYWVIYVPQYDGSPATKKYVDDGLALKQNILIPWTNITISGNTISANIAWVLVYKWNVATVNDLPSSWQTAWDTYFVEWEDSMYSWDWTQWNRVWWTWIDLTNFFNKTTDDSDDITQWSLHLFCTSTEKSIWNGKQDQLIAWANITIAWDGRTISATDTTYTEWTGIDIDINNQISNTLPFNPENAGTLAQVLKKTSTWYRWADEANAVRSVNWRTWDVTVEEFLPEGSWTTGQFLQKTADGYDWVNAILNYTPWTWININSWVISNILPFNPENTGSTWQVLKKTSTGYQWANESWGWWGGWGWGSYSAWYWISIIGNVISNTKPFDVTGWDTWQVVTKTANWYEWKDIELPSWENNVKFWTINSGTVSAQILDEIMEWVEADNNNWAILNDSATNDVFIFHDVSTSWNTKFWNFWGKKRISKKVTQPNGWDYTEAYEQMLKINKTTGSATFCTVMENPDDSTHTNYISAMTQWIYNTPFIPTDPYQPATKQYVDAAIIGGWGWVLWITQNTTWTTYAVSQEWVGTQAQYDLITPVNWVIYNIIPSS